MHFSNGLKKLLFMWFVLIGTVSFAAAASKNTPECKNFLLSEAGRMETEISETVEAYGRKIEAVFTPRNFEGDKDKALMMKGAYISFFNKNLRTSILKIHTIPGAYRKAAKMERYPKVCDRMAKFKETNDKAIQTHAKVWEKALEIASTFKQK